MKNVILPTDFSDNSWKAMCYAAQLYADLPTVFHLIHTFTLPLSQVETGMMPDISILQLDSANGLKKMALRFKELDHHDKSEFLQVSRFSTLVNVIADIEEDFRGESTIVMGTKGAARMGELFLGTMTSHVLKHSKSNLIVVPNSANLERPKKVMLAVDEHGIDHKSEIALLIELARRHNSEIHLVNVPTGSEHILQTGGREQLAIDQYLEGIQHSYHSLVGVYKEDLLTRYAETNKIDLITLIKRDRGFWGNLFHRSLTKSMSFYCDLPILILKD